MKIKIFWKYIAAYIHKYIIETLLNKMQIIYLME